MYCCTECFLDEHIKKLVNKKGEIGKCDFCHNKNVSVIDPCDLADTFSPVVALYSAQVEHRWMEDLDSCEGQFIWEKLTEDWEIFDDPEIGKAIITEIFTPIDPSDPLPLFLDNYVDRENEFWGHDQDFSNTLIDKWKVFCNEIIYQNRFIPEKSLDEEEVREILGFSRVTLTPDIKHLFRARLSQQKNKYKPKEMGKPPQEKTVEGRANPMGIAYLYLASDPDTAIAEIRPQVHDKVTIGNFKIKEAISVIDLRTPQVGSPFKWGDNLEYVIKIQGFLKMLGHILSRPIDRNRSSLKYLPTQYLCEFIKRQGFEGVIYESNLGEGHNIVLFDESKVKCMSTELIQVTSI